MPGRKGQWRLLSLRASMSGVLLRDACASGRPARGRGEEAVRAPRKRAHRPRLGLLASHRMSASDSARRSPPPRSARVCRRIIGSGCVDY
eukprot:112350-Chlamydomonas_euryale.AAC.2